MLEPIHLAILVASGLIVFSIFSSLIAFRIGAPLLLLFLGVGLAAGEDGVLGIPFDNAQLAYFVGSVCLAIILFDSGYGTSFHSFRLAAWPAVTLATIGVVLTALLAGTAAHFLFGLPWMLAFLLGAIVSSTDAAAVFFLLRVGGITIRDRTRSTLEIESGSNDPMAIFLTLSLVELAVSGAAFDQVSWEVAEGFARQIGFGGLAGLAGGWLIVQTNNRINLDPGLYPLVALTGALFLFAAVSLVDGSGFLAVYIAGILAGNSRLRSSHALNRFQAGMSWLAQITMFLTLGLLATPSHFPEVLGPAILLGLVLIFLARPVAVWICLLPFRFSRNATTFIAWVGLRGAVSILLAILPILGGLPAGQMFFNIAFIVVLTSLLIQGWTIRPMGHWLGMIVPERLGPVERFELDLPGQANHELVSYRVAADSRVARGERIPRWARPALVMRDGQSMRLHRAGRPRAGDQVYIFIAPEHVRLLDRLFAAPVSDKAADAAFFGDFVLAADTRISAVAATYALDLPEADSELTLAGYMHRELGSRVEPGDRLQLGPIELIVRETDGDDRVKTVGLAVEATGIAQPKLPLFQTRRDLRSLLRRLRRRRR